VTTAPPERAATRRGWRARSKAGWTGLAVALLLACIFTAWPQLDLWFSGLFHGTAGKFIGDDFAFVRFLYLGIPVSGRVYALIGLVVIAISLWRPHPFGARWSRRLVALAWVSLLGSGLLVNAGLKEYWGRARPVQVTQFGGTQQFSPALRPADECRHNCSFVSGHATSGFILMAVGLMGSVATRRRWLWIGLAWGTVVSLARIAEGGHFLSDTLFAGLAVWASGWLIREAWLRIVALRWRRARRRRAAPVAG
jgi:membrane-associated PAP2 superfamily phosphatase